MAGHASQESYSTAYLRQLAQARGIFLQGGESRDVLLRLLREQQRRSSAPRHSRHRRAPKVDWRSTPAGHARYLERRAEAQRRANETGYDHGLEYNELFRDFHVSTLPARQHRAGHELRVEVVHPERLESVKPGHGPHHSRHRSRVRHSKVPYRARKFLPRSAWALPERAPHHGALLLTDERGHLDATHVRAAASRLSMMRHRRHVTPAEYARARRAIMRAACKVGVKKTCEVALARHG